MLSVSHSVCKAPDCEETECLSSSPTQMIYQNFDLRRQRAISRFIWGKNKSVSVGKLTWGSATCWPTFFSRSWSILRSKTGLARWSMVMLSWISEFRSIIELLREFRWDFREPKYNFRYCAHTTVLFNRLGMPVPLSFLGQFTNVLFTVQISVRNCVLYAC